MGGAAAVAVLAGGTPKELPAAPEVPKAPNVEAGVAGAGARKAGGVLAAGEALPAKGLARPLPSMLGAPPKLRPAAVVVAGASVPKVGTVGPAKAVVAAKLKAAELDDAGGAPKAVKPD